MEKFESFLKKTENHFNWHLTNVDVNRSRPVLEQLKHRMVERSQLSEACFPGNDWPLQLTYGYELFSENPIAAARCVRETIDLIIQSDDPLNVKYRVPFLHVARSTLAIMVFKSGSSEVDQLVELADQLSLIKPTSDMTKEEFSGVLAVKAQTYRYYGPAGTIKGMPLVRQAVRLNPQEEEWKISLVVSLNRKRHFFKGCDVTWDQIDEPVTILEELKNGKLNTRQTVEVNYLLANAYYDYSMMKPPCPEMKSCKDEILNLCNEVYEKTDFPQFLSFCAERFTESRGFGNKRQLGIQIIDTLLKKFPRNIPIHMAACKLMRSKGDFATAAQHAKVALDNGCYGAIWLWLQCKFKLQEEVDVDVFFQDVLKRFQKMYLKQTHLNASMYYFFVKRDPVRGARHIHHALLEDPNFANLYNPYRIWYLRNVSVYPVEIAYNQIVLALDGGPAADDLMILKRAKNKIEEVTNVEEFARGNLVEDLWTAHTADQCHSHPRDKSHSISSSGSY